MKPDTAKGGRRKCGGYAGRRESLLPWEVCRTRPQSRQPMDPPPVEDVPVEAVEEVAAGTPRPRPSGWRGGSRWPPASSGSRLTADTLALGLRLPRPGPAGDSHPRSFTHAGRTAQSPKGLALRALCVMRPSALQDLEGCGRQNGGAQWQRALVDRESGMVVHERGLQLLAATAEKEEGAWPLL